MLTNKPDYYNNLDKIYAKILLLLDNGFKNRDNPFHIPVFICGENKNFDGRIIVLRGFDKKEKILSFHSDIRSNKIEVLKSNSISGFLFYDKKEKIQLRISSKAKIHYQNDLTKKSWGETVHMSRQCYLGSKAPGNNSLLPASGLSENIDNSKYTIEESEERGRAE